MIASMSPAENVVWNNERSSRRKKVFPLGSHTSFSRAMAGQNAQECMLGPRFFTDSFFF